MITKIAKRTKDFITINSIKRDIDNIKVLTPDILSEFFYWFYNTQKSFDLFNDEKMIQVHSHRAITRVSFYYLERGDACAEIYVIDTDNKNIMRIFIFTITNIIRLKEIVTYSGFENGYNVKFYDEFDVLDKSVHQTLFIVTKNLIRHSVLKRVNYLLNGGQEIDKAIPDIFR